MWWAGFVKDCHMGASYLIYFIIFDPHWLPKAPEYISSSLDPPLIYCTFNLHWHCTCHYMLSRTANKSYLKGVMISPLPVLFLSKEKQTRVIRHFHFHGWPEVGIPAEGKGMIDIIASVQRQQQQSGNHPIVVHCRYISTRFRMLVLA